MKSHILAILVLFIVGLPTIFPLFSKGFFPMHDDTQVARVVTMGKALRNGQFPVRWVSDLGYGYGYPIFNFYGPLPYYFGGFFYAIGFSGLLATKLMLIVGMISAAITMYFLASRVTGKLVSIFSSILYIYFPYHAVQLYVRGSIGELWVLIFLPLIIASMYIALVEKRHSLAIFVGTIGIAGTILSHTILGFTTAFFYLLGMLYPLFFMVIRKVTFKEIIPLFITIASGLAVSCFFWLPAIMEMKYTVVSHQIGPTARVFDHFVCLQQFWYSSWGFGGSAPGCVDGLSFMLGKIHIFIIIGGIIAILAHWKKNIYRTMGLLFITILFISLFFMTNYSSVFWNIIPGFSYVQYPWRFLVYTAVGIAGISTIFFMSIQSKLIQNIVAVIGIIAVVLFNAKLFVPQYTYDRTTAAFESDEDIQFRASRVSDEYLPSVIERPHDASKVIKFLIPQTEYYQYKNIVDRETYKKIEFRSGVETRVILNQAYFPGWKYWVNSNPQPFELDKGRPVISIPKDFSTLEMRFTDTPSRLLGNVISLISVVVLGYYYGKKTIS